MDQQSIKALIELVDKTNIGEVKIEQGNFKLTIRHKDYHPKGVIQAAPASYPAPASPAPVSVQNAAPAAAPEIPAPASPATEQVKPASSEDVSRYQTVRSPMIGTFYRSPSPDQEPYVKVGDSVKKGDVLGIIEAMKLFNEIESEYSGIIVKVLVDNTTPIEYDQPLFLIDPS